MQKDAAVRCTARQSLCLTGFDPPKGTPTVNSFETERYAGRPETVAAMRKALEKAGVEFTNGKRPGVRLYAIRHEAPDTPRGTPGG